MRGKIVAGNWKMNKTVAETKQFVSQLSKLVSSPPCKVVLCVPFTNLSAAVETAKGTPFEVGAQNVHWENSGAFTGEISVAMLKEAEINCVIVGHSERRQYFGETNETVKRRTAAALAGGLTPIVCVGETLEQREGGKTESVLKQQVAQAFEGLQNEQLHNIVVAYEPVWAIGTGKTATAAEADQTIGYIRGVLSQMFADAGANIPILYGGSMNEKNAAELMSMPNIDGGLIGGASLDAEKFAAIIGAAV